MTKSLLTGSIAGAVLSALVAGTAQAQYAPMDMSWGIQSQMRNWQIGNQMAYDSAMAYYNYMRRLRAQGYRGPSLPTGVTNESLRRSIDGANAATQRYIRSGEINSARRSNAIGDYTMRAVRGCSYGVNYWGQPVYVCP
jgi:hypothetical protein